MAKNKKAIKMTPANIVFVVVFCIVLIIYALSMIYPLLWGLNTSLKNRYDFNINVGGNVLGFPTLDATDVNNSREQFLHLANYKAVIDRLEMTTVGSYYQNGVLVHEELAVIKTGLGRMIVNTLIFCGVAAVLKAFVPAVAAYLCAKYKYASSSIIYYVILIAMTIPIVGTQPAELEMLRNLGIYSSWFQHVLQTFNMNGMYFFVFYAYYQGLSDTYMEAAEIDGASQFRIVLTIVIPLSITTITAVMLLTFVQYWNNYQTPTLYFPRYPTLAQGVQYIGNLAQDGLGSVVYKLASCMMLAIPLLILFLCFHKKLMGNLSLGGIKE